MLLLTRHKHQTQHRSQYWKRSTLTRHTSIHSTVTEYNNTTEEI